MADQAPLLSSQRGLRWPMWGGDGRAAGCPQGAPAAYARRDSGCASARGQPHTCTARPLMVDQPAPFRGPITAPQIPYT